MLEGGQKLLTQYKGEAEVKPSNCVLLSVGGEVEADKKGGDGGRFGNGGSVIFRPLHCVIVTPVHSFVYCIFII